MVTQPLDPNNPEEPGKPNPEVEVEPERPIEISLQPEDEAEQPSDALSRLSKEAPETPAEGGDYISEIRQSLVSEETTRSKRGTGSLIRRITGSLRRVTGPLRNTDALKDEKKESEPESPTLEMFETSAPAEMEAQAAGESGIETEIPDELFAARFDQQAQEISGDEEDGGLFDKPAQTLPGNLHTRPLDSSLSPEVGSSGEEEAISDDFLGERFGRSRVDEAPKISLTDGWGDQPDTESETGERPQGKEKPSFPPRRRDKAIENDSTLFPLESGEIRALGMAEEEAQQGADSDWMSEIRAEAQEDGSLTGQEALFTDLDAPDRQGMGKTQPEQPSAERPSLRGVTGQLRNFFTGILGRKEKQGQPEESAIPDELVSDRLVRSLGTETIEEKPAAGIRAEDIFSQEEGGETLLEETFPAVFPETPVLDEAALLEAPIVQEPVDFLEGLEVNFTDVGEVEPSEELNGYELYPEDEAILWGTGEQPAAEEAAPEDVPYTPEDIWGSDNDTFGYGSDLRAEIWGDANKPEVPIKDYFSPADITNPDEPDEYAATYLTGTDFLPPMVEEDKAGGQDDMLAQVLEESAGSEEQASVQDLRSIALEDYEEGENFDYSDYTYKIDWGDEDQTSAAGAEEMVIGESEDSRLREEESEAEIREALSTDWKSWFVNRKPLHKVLIVEAVVAVLAMVIALPIFLFIILRGPLTADTQVQPAALPAGLPHPTGLTLPGGWYFPLEKSTFANGKWQPSTSEWLEGSELRRVVALPWNPQTEAVIQTFQVGDGVELYLSNNDTVKYRVSSIEQVEVSNTQIYSDRNPSLAIILYQDKNPTRWVIICKP